MLNASNDRLAVDAYQVLLIRCLNPFSEMRIPQYFLQYSVDASRYVGKDLQCGGRPVTNQQWTKGSFAVWSVPRPSSLENGSYAAHVPELPNSATIAQPRLTFF